VDAGRRSSSLTVPLPVANATKCDEVVHTVISEPPARLNVMHLEIHTPSAVGIYQSQCLSALRSLLRSRARVRLREGLRVAIAFMF